MTSEIDATIDHGEDTAEDIVVLCETCFHEELSPSMQF